MDFSNFKNQWIEHNTNLPKNQGNYRENVVDPKFQSFSNSGKLGVYNGILLYLTYEHKNSTIGYHNIRSSSHNMPNEFAFIDILNAEAIASNPNCFYPQECEHAFLSEYDIKFQPYFDGSSEYF